MIISSLFVKHKVQPPRFAPSIFLLLIACFVVLGEVKPIYGLIGLGTTVIIGGFLVELNRDRIWDLYIKSTKKRKGFNVFTRPNRIYYNINVYMVWPFVIFLGIVCLWTAFLMS